MRYVYNIPLELRHPNPSENSPNRVKCHKIVMIYLQPVRRHHHLDIHINYACSCQLPP